jgi:hypothetical protein
MLIKTLLNRIEHIGTNLTEVIAALALYSGPHFQDKSLRWCLRQKGAGNERKEAQKFHQPVQDESGT